MDFWSYLPTLDRQGFKMPLVFLLFTLYRAMPTTTIPKKRNLECVFQGLSGGYLSDTILGH